MKQEVERPAVEDDDAVKQVDGTLSWSVTETDPTGRKRFCNQAKATRTADNAASLAPARNDASVEDVSVESNPVLTRHRFVRSAERGGSMKQIVGSGAERLRPSTPAACALVERDRAGRHPPKGAAGGRSAMKRVLHGSKRYADTEADAATVAVESERESVSTDCETRPSDGFQTVCPCGRERVAPRFVGARYARHLLDSGRGERWPPRTR